ncbi:interferon-stimulated exonuclease-like 2 [Plakobranchus ocellatus]|uniref:Interferon-stimulated exonuclease-like 2 n=1 Tax=Plakobranchus ocellatus TaxID=259542 RepID=A0AAV4CML3_9GAST|nr:interferon-stimulated exonuclease-like 2 [Plakobranchus ocellatus]
MDAPRDNGSERVIVFDDSLTVEKLRKSLGLSRKTQDVLNHSEGRSKVLKRKSKKSAILTCKSSDHCTQNTGHNGFKLNVMTCAAKAIKDVRGETKSKKWKGAEVLERDTLFSDVQSTDNCDTNNKMRVEHSTDKKTIPCDEFKTVLRMNKICESSAEAGCRKQSGLEDELSLCLEKEPIRQAGSSSSMLTLTDFERFAVQNRDRLFQETCFPSKIGQECAICDNGVSDRPVLSEAGCDTWSSEISLVLRHKNGKSRISSGDGQSLNEAPVCHLRKSKRRRSSLSEEQVTDESVSKAKSAKICNSRLNGNGSQQDAASYKSNGGSLNSLISLESLYKETDNSDTESCAVSSKNKVASTETEKEKHNVQERLPWTSLHVNIPDWMYVAVDCEMVGTGPKGHTNALARCSIVDYGGSVMYDKIILPEVPITDYRTRWSGIKASHMSQSISTLQALREIHELLANKIIVGHSVYNDLRVLRMSPPFYVVRDTAQCKALVRMAGLEGQGNALRKLTAALLGRLSFWYTVNTA